MSWRLGSSWVCVVVAALAMSLAFAPPVLADDFDRAVAEIQEALETNPMGVSPDSLDTCRAMLKTAVLLRKMGKGARAVRRIKSCRRLLGLDDSLARRTEEPGALCA